MPPELVDTFRVTTHEIGTLGNWNVNHYMIHESDALVLTRTAMGEAPDNLDDRVLVMWLIKIRAELGYKNGRWGFVGTIDRWGPPSSIKMEALCIGGCQFEVWRAAMYVTNPARLATTGILRKMLHPTDDQLPAFYATYRAAEAIVAADLSDAPMIIRGYDGFISPGASDTHYIDWKPNGLKRLQLNGEGGNVWIDHFKQDNHYWNLLPGRLAQTPSATPEPTATATQLPAATATKTAVATATAETQEPESRAKVDQPPAGRAEPKGVAIMETAVDAIVGVGMIAILCEAIFETIKPLWDKEKRKELPDRLGALAVGEAVALLGGVDIFAAVGVPLVNLEPLGAWPGIALTGVLLSRGANLVHDLLKSLKQLPDLLAKFTK